jgi:transcriptional regulator with XRE-family HTH domain
MSVREMLSRNLAYYRKKAGLNQTQAAEKIGTKKTTLASWEQNKSQPDADMLVALAMAYHVSLSELCGMDYDMQITPFEMELIRAYRCHPEHRASINCLLCLREKKDDTLQEEA